MNVTIVTFCHYDAVVRAQFDSIHVNQLNSIRVNNINTSSVSMLVAVVDAWVLLSSMSMPGCHVLALRADAHCFHDSCTQAMLQSPNQYFGPAQYISYVQQDINHMSQIRGHIHKSSRQSLIPINNKMTSSALHTSISCNAWLMICQVSRAVICNSNAFSLQLGISLPLSF